MLEGESVNIFFRSKFLLLGVLIFLLLAAVVAESQTKFIRRFYDNVVMDNRNHYLSCDRLPTITKVTDVVEKHKDTIEQIEQIHPGQIGLEVDSFSCPGKADIIIWYASHEDRIKIEQIINDETFFGIPYRLQNR